VLRRRRPDRDALAKNRNSRVPALPASHPHRRPRVRFGERASRAGRSWRR